MKMNLWNKLMFIEILLEEYIKNKLKQLWQKN